MAQILDVPILGGEQSLLGLNLRLKHPDFGLKSYLIPPARGWPKWLNQAVLRASG